jgi:exonuclease VII large subunit
LAILARGYSVTRQLPSKRLVRSASEVAPGDHLLITLAQGEVTAETLAVRDGRADD